MSHVFRFQLSTHLSDFVPHSIFTPGVDTASSLSFDVQTGYVSDFRSTD